MTCSQAGLTCQIPRVPPSLPDAGMSRARTRHAHWPSGRRLCSPTARPLAADGERTHFAGGSPAEVARPPFLSGSALLLPRDRPPSDSALFHLPPDPCPRLDGPLTAGLALDSRMAIIP
jgi:hypothetical protein